MLTPTQKRSGFTIVELLIVIVVIAILAAISTVAYSGIQTRARQSKMASLAKQAATKVQLHNAENGQYPGSLVDAGVETPSGATLDYAQAPNWFCVVATATEDNTKAGVGSTGSCGGIRAEYFNNTILSGSPVVTRIDPDLNNYWSTGSPGPGINADNFSVRWTGYITAPTSANYTLHLWHDDNFRLYLNDVLVSDRWGTGGCCVWTTVNYSFIAGQTIPIRVEMNEGGGGAGTRIHWSYPGQAQTPIPSTALSF